MNQEHHNAVREAVIKANPEIMELKFGCEVLREGAPKREFICGMFNDTVSLVRVDELGAWLPFEIPKPPASQDWKVIGRPIRLDDCVKALRKAGYNSTEDWFEVIAKLADGWQLGTLEDQGEPLINYLYEKLN